MNSKSHSAAMWDWIDRWSQVFDAGDSLVVRPPKITLISTKTANEQHPPPPPARAPSLPVIVPASSATITLLSAKTTNRRIKPHPARAPAPSLPVIVPASSETARDQFRRRSMSVPTIAPLPATVALRSAVTHAQLLSGHPAASGEATHKATGEGHAGSLLRRLSRGGNAPARSFLAEVQWAEAWRQLQPTEAAGGAACSHVTTLEPVDCLRASKRTQQSPSEHTKIEQAAARHAARVAGGIRRASFCGSGGVEQAAVQDAPGRDLVARMPAHAPLRRGSM